MKAIQLIILSLFLSFAAGHAQEAKELLKKGNAHYASKEYAKAISAYQSVIERGKESAALYFNLGNAFFRTGAMPKAVLYYEKARLLQPNDPEIKENLKMARQLTGDEIEAVPEFFLTRWRKTVMNWLSADVWGYISLAAFLALLAAIGFYAAGRRAAVKRSAFSAGIILLLLTGISFSMGYAQKQRIEAHNSAIVFSPSVTVRSAPNQSSTSLFVIHKGTKVHIRSHSGDWYEIRIANGEVGWLKKEDVRRI